MSLQVQLRRQRDVGGFHQYAAIAEHDGRNNVLSAVVLLNDTQAVRVFIHIDEPVSDAVFAEELFGPLAVLAPCGAIHCDPTVSDVQVPLRFRHDTPTMASRSLS
jgi:hypothetical protein